MDTLHVKRIIQLNLPHNSHPNTLKIFTLPNPKQMITNDVDSPIKPPTMNKAHDLSH
jgi:hypothetical protein